MAGPGFAAVTAGVALMEAIPRSWLDCMPHRSIECLSKLRKIIAKFGTGLGEGGFVYSEEQGLRNGVAELEVESRASDFWNACRAVMDHLGKLALFTTIVFTCATK